mmetsp:Transcript_75100/g.165846  ORF Transcript_75100/g.165846 Transcript_75100/m.165846 type:complete len:80 (-) Transcript_75100:534-773(-)
MGPSEVEDFQQLCLLLEPTRLAALEAEQEEDEYDDGPPAPEASPPCPVEIASKSVVLSGEIGSHQRCVVNGGSGLRSPS